MPIQISIPRLRKMVFNLGVALHAKDHALVTRRHQLLETLLQESPDEAREAHLRACALGSILLDLTSHGWELAVEEGELYLCEPLRRRSEEQRDAAVSKERARKSMRPRVLEQLLRPGYRRLVQDMERGDWRTGRGAAALLADGAALADALEQRGAAAIEPYVQLARPADGLDLHTGLRLHDCFRYMRLHWSFPYETTPGRRLPFLIRDAGQPHHPIMGLLCLSSPIPELGARDRHLGWTPGWLEATLAGLEALERATLGEPAALIKLQHELERLNAANLGAPTPAALAAQLASTLGLSATPHELAALGAALRRPPAAGLREVIWMARGQLLGGLLKLIDEELEALSFEGLGVASEEARSGIDAALVQLSAVERDAYAEWRRGRAQRMSALDLREQLFTKKRARRAIALLHATSELEELRATLSQGPVALRELTWTLAPATAPGGALTGGAALNEGLRVGLREHKIRMLASQLADVSVCGALPPYRELLGGKLAASLALSREVAQAYFDAYEGRVSEIQSRLSDAAVIRPSRLLALSTTSFYAVGSAQYNRVSLPAALGGLRWRAVGESLGHGTLHLSTRTSRLVQQRLGRDERRVEVSGLFGEGPSERMRKLREGMLTLGLPAEELLRHGMNRIVYVAALDPACRPGVEARQPHHEMGPSAAEITAWWRERWLSPRLQEGARRAALRAFTPTQGLISACYPEAALLAPKPAEEGDEL